MKGAAKEGQSDNRRQRIALVSRIVDVRCTFCSFVLTSLQVREEVLESEERFSTEDTDWEREGVMWIEERGEVKVKVCVCDEGRESWRVCR
jgi:hypothetical protein